MNNLEVQGFLIRDSKGNYLSKLLSWFDHDSHKDAYVHPIDSLKGMKEKFAFGKANSTPGHPWSLPKEIIPASWSSDNGVQITGDSQPWID